MIRLAVLATLPVLLGAAGPSVEYGGATEQRFVEACRGEGRLRATCACVSERLQAQLGYEAFHEAAVAGPTAFRHGLLAALGDAAREHCAGLGEATAGLRERMSAALGAPR